MNFDNLQQLILTQFKILRGTIRQFSDKGEIIVTPESGDEEIACLMLRSSDKELIGFSIGDQVLCAIDDERGEGYVLGVIEAYHPVSEAAEAKSVNKKETPDEIQIKAGKRVEINCGKSSFIMNEEGQIYIKGVKIVSRASQVQKIKGASVQIN